MQPRHAKRSPGLAALLSSLLALSLFCDSASAQPKGAPQRAEVKRAVLNQSALRPGDKAMLAVEFEVKEGFHAQSRTPGEQYEPVKFTLLLDKNDAVTFGEPVYPKGRNEEYPGLGKLNVYTGAVVIYVPVEVKADAKPGDISFTGAAKYQACDDKVCYPPAKAKFEAKTSVVPAGTEVKPNEPELFKDAGKDAATAEPDKKASAAAPGTAGPTAAVAPAKIFGRELGNNAYLLAFFGAFIVGVVFNIMPCVLPVVPLKIMGFYEVAQHSRGRSLAFGAVFSAGLVASFGVLAVLIVALRVIDWGELFTKPWFILPMVIVLVAMAISMFGLFTVRVPTALYNVAPRHDTYVGNFLFGVLTAALSTPCTFGMFVGLLAWALTQPAAVGVALIMTVGVGMAFPYFVLSAFPEVARKFPRGGAGGEVVKQFMGFLLLATAVYFASPLIRAAASQETVWWLIFTVIAAGSLFLLVRGIQVSKTMVGRVAAAVVALGILVPSTYAVRLLTIKPFEWQPYSPQALEQARAQGKTVLVEFTATWCGNCHFLEATVLKSRTIVQAVHDYNIVMMKADVTDEGAAGRPLLAQLSPAGAIPLTAVYVPGSPGPTQLTGIYEKSELKKVLDAAAAAKSTVAAVR
jgi:thiol:disulfide interchange protein DsbD